MCFDNFAQKIELPLKWAERQGYSKSFTKATIERTLRIALAEPELSQKYYDKLAKATMDELLTYQDIGNGKY